MVPRISRISLAALVGLTLAGAALAQTPPAVSPAPPPSPSSSPADALPDGPGKAVIQTACTMCHDVSTVTEKPRAPDDWHTIIGQMVDNGAKLTAEEQDAVYAYLVKNYGKPAAAPAADANSPSNR